MKLEKKRRRSAGDNRDQKEGGDANSCLTRIISHRQILYNTSLYAIKEHDGHDQTKTPNARYYVVCIPFFFSY